MFRRVICLLALVFNKGAGFHIPVDFCHHISISIVKSTTSLLPTADGVGHHILHTNEKIINGLLENDRITMEIKKPVILNLIRAARMGDETGGIILERYEQLVDKLLSF